MQLALTGIATSGVKTIFSAISGHAESEGAYTGGPGQARLSTLKIPDERLENIHSVFKPPKMVQTTVELAEYPGLFGGPSTDNQNVAKVREADAVVLILRTFESVAAPHLLGSVDPQRDLDQLQSDMVIADLAIVETRLERLEKNLRRQNNDEDAAEQEILLRCKDVLDQGKCTREMELSEADEKRIGNFLFLTRKSLLLILNIGENQIGEEESLKQPFTDSGYEVQALCGSLEAELSQLDEEERAEFMGDFGIEELAAPVVLGAAYRILQVVTFFTHNEKECRAWNVEKGDTAVIAAGKIHTDLAQGFIRAETIAYDDFKEHGDISGAKAAGKFRLEGRDYVVQEGDLITIRHNA